jgi:hypothetical protein
MITFKLAIQAHEFNCVQRYLNQLKLWSRFRVGKSWKYISILKPPSNWKQKKCN